MTAPTELCHRLLPGMRALGRGRIINVASLAGLLRAPAGHTLYAASKAYLIKFSQALALENQRHAINVCALCPGFTYSEFHAVNGTRPQMQRLSKRMWMSADGVARDGLAAVERGDVVRRLRRPYSGHQTRVRCPARPSGAASHQRSWQAFPGEGLAGFPIAAALT